MHIYTNFISVLVQVNKMAMIAKGKSYYAIYCSELFSVAHE